MPLIPRTGKEKKRSRGPKIFWTGEAWSGNNGNYNFTTWPWCREGGRRKGGKEGESTFFLLVSMKKVKGAMPLPLHYRRKEEEKGRVFSYY